MFNHAHYVPLMKTKAGELEALEKLTGAQSQGLTPLLELFQDLDYDDATFQPLDKFAKKVRRAWPHSRPIFFDAVAVEGEPQIHGAPPAQHLFDRLLAVGLPLIPVTDPWRSSDYQQAVKHAASRSGLGICIRLIQGEDVEIDEDELEENIDELLNLLEVTEGEIDIISDWGEISSPPTRGLVATVVGELNNLPHLAAWRTVTLASAAFPQSVTRAASGTRLLRNDWTMWRRVCRHSALLRRPTFGDYACINPTVPDLDFTKIAVAPKVKYTCDNDWLVFKGVSHRSAAYSGNHQFRTLAQNVISSPEFKGRLFSWGDAYIEDCANSVCGPGNNTKWVSVCANHHLAMVVDQIPTFAATLP